MSLKSKSITTNLGPKSSPHLNHKQKLEAHPTQTNRFSDRLFQLLGVETHVLKKAGHIRTFGSA